MYNIVNKNGEFALVTNSPNYFSKIHAMLPGGAKPPPL